MKARGRQSTADIARLTDTSDGRVYLQAPDDLSKEHRDLWYTVVMTKPPEWFKSDSAPVLEAYVRAVVHHRQFCARLDALKKDAPVSEVTELVNVISRLAILLSTLAAKMRLTQQSRYTPETAARRDRDSTASRPWND